SGAPRTLTHHPLAGRRHLRTGRMAAAVPVHPRRHHLRRFGRDRTQHHRRACGRPAEGGTPVTQPPPYPAGRNLLGGKIVAITAAAGTGIGSAVARRCLEEGASVVISDAHGRRLTETAAELAELGPVHALPCHVTDVAQVNALVSGTVEHFGRLDVMINNAGLGGTASVLEMTDEQWDTVVDVTLNGTFRCTRAALRQFEAQGGGGAVVNNASVVGWRAQQGQAHYAAAKAGVMALTRCAAMDAADNGSRVNAVAPSLASHAYLGKVGGPEVHAARA